MARYLLVTRTLTGTFLAGSPPAPISPALQASIPYQKMVAVSSIRAVVLEPDVRVDTTGATPQNILTGINLYLELVDSPSFLNPAPAPAGLVTNSARTVLVALARLTKLEPPRIANLIAFAGQVPTKLLSANDIETIAYTDFDA
jgi:hypothetical protein